MTAAPAAGEAPQAARSEIQKEVHMMNFKLSVLAFAVLVAFGCAFAPCAAEAEASGLIGGEENRADGSDNEKLGEEFTYIFFSYSLSWYDPRMPITIKQVDDKYILAVGDDGRRRDEGNQEKTFEIADEDVMEIRLALDECNVRAWNGFYESDPYALDGYAYSMDVAFADGGVSKSHGSNRSPKGFGKFRDKMFTVIDKYCPLK